MRRPEPAARLAADQARRVTRAHARTFSLACRFLPRRVRADVYRLYAVFRTVDDLVDTGDPDAAARVAALARWGRGGPASSPETVELDRLAEHAPELPRGAFADFAAGMEFDLAGRAVETHAELEAYCYEVAGTVGLVMAAVLGAGAGGDDAAVALGQAMQLTNILRDIDEDLALGRRYLPVEATELAPERRAATLPAFIARADALYLQGMAGISRLSGGRAAITIAAVLYREILRQIERDGHRPGRARVRRRRKLGLVVATLVRLGLGRGVPRGRPRRPPSPPRPLAGPAG